MLNLVTRNMSSPDGRKVPDLPEEPIRKLVPGFILSRNRLEISYLRLQDSHPEAEYDLSDSRDPACRFKVPKQQRRQTPDCTLKLWTRFRISRNCVIWYTSHHLEGLPIRPNCWPCNLTSTHFDFVICWELYSVDPGTHLIDFAPILLQ